MADNSGAADMDMGGDLLTTEEMVAFRASRERIRTPHAGWAGLAAGGSEQNQSAEVRAPMYMPRAGQELILERQRALYAVGLAAEEFVKSLIAAPVSPEVRARRRADLETQLTARVVAWQATSAKGAK